MTTVLTVVGVGVVVGLTVVVGFGVVGSGVVVGFSVVGGIVVTAIRHVSSKFITSHMMPSNLSILMYVASPILCIEPLNGISAV